jgi:hypothetical protein
VDLARRRARDGDDGGTTRRSLPCRRGFSIATKPIRPWSGARQSCINHPGTSRPGAVTLGALPPNKTKQLAQATPRGRTQLQTAQREWLQSRRACGSNRTCIGQLDRDQIAWLRQFV